MFNSPNSEGTGGNYDDDDDDDAIILGEARQYSTSDDGYTKSTDNEFVSPNSVHQLGIAIQAGQRATDRLRYHEAHSRLNPPPVDGDDDGDDDVGMGESGDVMKLHWEDILVEDLLGVGGFCCVCRIRCKKLHRALQHPSSRRRRRSSSNDDDVVSPTGYDNNCDDDFSVPTSEEENWENMSNGSSRGSSSSHHSEPSGYYALKCLSNRTMMSPSMFVNGAADLVGEAFYLRRLNHPNIIRIYAISAGCTLDAFMKPGGYFLVVEAFHSILCDKLTEWRWMLSGKIRRDDSIDDDDDCADDSIIPSLATRLKYAVDVVQAMVYLHSVDVVFRDLKTQNCGIDDYGNVKLFDFGLAREVDEQGRYPGIAGSLRSMAPETILNKLCCKASDVYAFGMLLWELCTLQVPLDNLSKPSEFKDLVAIGGVRPPLDSILDQSIATVIENCWNGDLLKRPTFEQILGDLGRIVESLGRSGGLTPSESDPSTLTSPMDI